MPSLSIAYFDSGVVDVDFAAHDFERVAGDGHAAFDVVLALVDRTGDDRVVAEQFLAARPGAQRALVFAQHVVVGGVLPLEQHRVAGGEVEDHHVVALDAAQSFEPVVRPSDALREGFLRL